MRSRRLQRLSLLLLFLAVLGPDPSGIAPAGAASAAAPITHIDDSKWD